MRLSAASTIVAMGFALITRIWGGDVFPQRVEIIITVYNIYTYTPCTHNVSGVWKVIVRPSQV